MTLSSKEIIVNKAGEGDPGISKPLSPECSADNLHRGPPPLLLPTRCAKVAGSFDIPQPKPTKPQEMRQLNTLVDVPYECRVKQVSQLALSWATLVVTTDQDQCRS